MEQETVEKIRVTRQALAELVTYICPQSPTEWEALDLLSAAHRDMRRIKLDKLGQLPLPETKEPAEPPTEQRLLPGIADSFTSEGEPPPPPPPALVQTAEDEFNTLGHGQDSAGPIPEPHARKRGRHASD